MDLRYSGNRDNEVDLYVTDCPYDNDNGDNNGEGIRNMAYLSELLQWHIDDPVSTREITRNSQICEWWQGNRNPFVDYPDWAEHFFGKPQPMPYVCHPSRSIGTGTGTTVKNSDNAANANDKQQQAPQQQQVDGDEIEQTPNENTTTTTSDSDNSECQDEPEEGVDEDEVGEGFKNNNTSGNITADDCQDEQQGTSVEVVEEKKDAGGASNNNSHGKNGEINDGPESGGPHLLLLKKNFVEIAAILTYVFL